MKKYSICLFLLVFTSIVCFAAGYGLTKYRESREEIEESRTLPAQTVQEDFLAESETELLESISGQYQLWDEAAGVVATSAGTINSALETVIWPRSS